MMRSGKVWRKRLTMSDMYKYVLMYSVIMTALFVTLAFSNLVYFVFGGGVV